MSYFNEALQANNRRNDTSCHIVFSPYKNGLNEDKEVFITSFPCADTKYMGIRSGVPSDTGTIEDYTWVKFGQAPKTR